MAVLGAGVVAGDQAGEVFGAWPGVLALPFAEGHAAAGGTRGGWVFHSLIGVLMGFVVLIVARVGGI